LLSAAVGHPFDTVKVRLQTTDTSQFKGPLDCLLQTVRKEGFTGLYKGASPPLVGWMFMDSMYACQPSLPAKRSPVSSRLRATQLTGHSMLGSLSVYRRVLNDNFFNPRTTLLTEQPRLPVIGHALAGTLAGWTVSFIAAPVEHIKARLQIQYAAEKSARLYSGPIDCLTKIYRGHGVRGLYHGLSATLLFRTFFCFWWGTYDLFTRQLQKHTNLSTPAVNFWAGGLSAQIFWITSYPSDVVKQRIMTDPLGPERRFQRWRDAARGVYADAGWKGYWRGFVPCFLRAFPANAMALVAFEGVMRSLPE
jgi:solute carrier family 25 carnitine/acylcarnitine transporter 20/29